MKIEHRARTEHTLNKASATLFCRYSKRRFKSHYVYHLNCKSFKQTRISDIYIIINYMIIFAKYTLSLDL
ncbi:hypothetical protein HanRHA438_Chr00c52g0859041 [Helianthus annuus]|nr:hypothetical protein HanPI659440_Chr12g0480211 [Helianthus annuus]KAJ0805110.1 hypothetical protein HanPI659440_Chr02g0045911 [Helianthus annuus]KAJ0876079.1 hypothetical protein HanPSC8_Chr11g0484251 [Helianthus annuus]KAJ0953704.1 hypothetical protein HanRHA438_Chr00c52g0859041 [Helianthus annuus]